MRVAFTMRLKPGGIDEYRRQHDNIWPELVAEIKRAGIREFTTFVDDPVLFLFSEVDDEGAWDRLWHSEVHQRWSEVMEPLMDIDENGIVVSKTIPEIFHLEHGDS